MAAYITDSEFATVTTTEREKAWHLFALLLRIGRPARPAELASRCVLFRATPDFVEFLCCIPDSPLFLTDDLFVTISIAAFSAFGEFASKVIAPFVPRLRVRVLGPRRLWDDAVLTYFRKRKGTGSDSILLRTVKRRLISDTEHEEDSQNMLALANQMKSASEKVRVDVLNNMSRGMNFLPVTMSVMEYASGNLEQDRTILPSLLDSDGVLSNYKLKNIDHRKGLNEIEKNCNDTEVIIIHKPLAESIQLAKHEPGFLNIDVERCNKKTMVEEKVRVCEPDVEYSLLNSNMQKPVSQTETKMDENYSGRTAEMEERNQMSLSAAICKDEHNQPSALPMKTIVHDSPDCHSARSRIIEDAVTIGNIHFRKNYVIDTGTIRGDSGIPMLLDNTVQMGEIQNHYAFVSQMDFDDMTHSLKGQKEAKGELGADPLIAEPSNALRQPKKSFSKQKSVPRDASSLPLQVISQDLNENNFINSPKQTEQLGKNEKLISKKQKLKRSRNQTGVTNENKADCTLKTPKNHLDPRTLPNFESFIIEEEEGSGGYGTVYRSRRKNDGKIFAVKCPHANAHTHHVNNELKMLERFGGRNFVIKYEGSFKCGNAECFVLEHVEHDRPEVLKREIDIFELQWYGYCMFRALASLHKQGIVHRDVKPGNFLFSRKFNKGYLIDFNLAMDLHQKYSSTRKFKTNHNGSLDHVPLPFVKTAPPFTKARKVVDGTKGATKYSKSPVKTKNMKSSVDAAHLMPFPDLGVRNKYRSQNADGSGITSTKDGTSTRTPSGERLREPMPCQGRKELINLVQEAMQSPNVKAVTVSASQRKRVAASPGKMDRKLVYLTPMPLHSTGIAISGAGMFKSKGDGKQKREGPCFGTKGFRAPEVLFRSLHQGTKVDIWSAGVTFLYLIIGRTPFVGDPEQNIKDIAKLRGSEDLWEVAKLHNRESSFPPELFDIQSLPSIQLREWCEMNTRRSEFLERIPCLLFDLIDKCLTVNPRQRISAEEALRHEFFDPCHEALKKQRLLRQGNL